MKKLLSLLLCVVLCISVLCACMIDNPDTSGSGASIDIPSVDLSYDDVSYIIPSGDDSSAAESQAVISGESSESGDMSTENSVETSRPPVQQSGGFVIKLAKYDYNNMIEKQNSYVYRHDTNYGDVSIAILDVTNETDKNYSVKITGKYLDENGKVLKTETQEWDQFAARWQKYFLFRPHMQFDRFEYTVETTEYSGDCWKCGYSIPFASLTTENRMIRPDAIDDPNATSVEGLRATVAETVDTPFTIVVGIQYLVLFDVSGQVIAIYQSGEGYADPHTDSQIRPYFSVYYSDSKKMDEWPKRFQGNATGITIVSWIKKQ